MYVWNIHKSNYNKNIGEIAYIYIYTCTQHKFLTCLVFKKIYTKIKQYLSEDYGFCHLWTSLGGKIYANIKGSMGHHCGLGVNYEGNLYERIKYC